jgi:hypothetical protein
MMNIVRLEDGSIGFVDRRWLSKGFGALALSIGIIQFQGLVSTLLSGREVAHPIAMAIACVIMLIALFAGFCFVNNWHETWVRPDSKQIHVTGRFGFWKTDKIWNASGGGVIRPWMKSGRFTNNTTAGLNLESQGEIFEIFSGTEPMIPRVMQLGPHLAMLLDVPFEELEPVDLVDIYPATQQRPEGSDLTHFFEDLPDKTGRFPIGIGVILVLCWLTEPTNYLLALMIAVPASVCFYIGIALLRKFSQLKIDVERQTMTYRWRTLSKLSTKELPLDSLAAILVTSMQAENRKQRTYSATLYFGEHTMPLFSVLKSETPILEVQQKAWTLAEAFGCPMIVALGYELKAADKLSITR